jgi:hypothetical protein
VEALLSGILHFRVQHHMQQLALVRSLDLLLQQHPQVSGSRYFSCGGAVGVYKAQQYLQFRTAV